MEIPESPWRIDWSGDGFTGTATHAPTAVEVWVSRKGFGTVCRLPEGVPREEALRLMHEAMEIAESVSVSVRH
jgi:hypothetical protein